MRPSERNTATLCCVGFVFCSPTTPSTGTRLTCTQQKLPGPTLNWNCTANLYWPHPELNCTPAIFAEDIKGYGRCKLMLTLHVLCCMQVLPNREGLICRPAGRRRSRACHLPQSLDDFHIEHIVRIIQQFRATAPVVSLQK